MTVCGLARPSGRFGPRPKLHATAALGVRSCRRIGRGSTAQGATIRSVRTALAAAVILGTGLTSAACGEEEPASTDDAQPTPCIEEFQSLALEPSTARPGQRLTVRYPSRAPTNEQLLMDRISDGRCTTMFLLYHEGDKVAWEDIEGKGSTVMMMGEFKRVESHPAVVPDAAEPGSYQVCAPASRPSTRPACAVLTVEG